MNLVPNKCPALVLNADYQPLSYFPLSTWSWKNALKAVFLDRVNVVSEYNQVVRSPSTSLASDTASTRQESALDGMPLRSFRLLPFCLPCFRTFATQSACSRRTRCQTCRKSPVGATGSRTPPWWRRRAYRPAVGAAH